MDQVIVIQDVSIRFKLERGRSTSIKEYMIRFFKDQLSYEEFWALKNISMEVEKGDAVGIVGTNGAGKSTLLKLIAGVMTPSNGTVKVNGIIAPMIELGAGFDSELTGRENIFLNGALMGFSRKEMEKRYNDIVEFSELEGFIETTVKNYSSGMFMRLAFSIAISVNPDILIIDEVLSVGDARFQKKCMDRIQEIKERGTTILFVSHSADQVKAICNKALWLEKGELKRFGRANEVITAYTEFLGVDS